VAIGAGKSFAKGEIFSQIRLFCRNGGNLKFVKSYKKSGQSILQFRVTEPSGMLHYFDFHIFKAKEGATKIEDIQNYESGPVLSDQIVEFVKNRESKNKNNMANVVEALKNAQEGKRQEAYTIIESLPDDFKQLEPVMSARIRLGMPVDAKKANELLIEFKNKYPHNPSAIFAAYMGCLVSDNSSCAIATIDDIYSEIGGDEFLLWLKANLLAEQRQFDKAVSVLSAIADDFGGDVSARAEKALSKDLISSRQYTQWKARSKAQKN
jgi:hypothetical protein